MTVFEGLILLAAIVVVIIITNGVALIVRKLNEIIDKQCINLETLSNIRGDTIDIIQELNNIEDNILDDLRDIRLADKLGKTSPNVPTPLPCYSPNGICVNQQMDCIGCPRRGTGGTWSTNIVKED